MRLINNGKRRKCRHCKELIYSFEPRYTANEGVYCVNDGRVKSLHEGMMKFVKGVVNGE